MNIKIIDNLEDILNIEYREEVEKLNIQDFNNNLFSKIKAILYSFLEKNNTKSLDLFDPNILISKLPNLKLKEGFILDYVYITGNSFGYPLFYVREENSKPFIKIKDYKSWIKNNNIYEFINLDHTKDSYFQLSMLLELGETFFLYWHSNYDSKTVITDTNKILFWFDKKSKELIKNMDFNPKVDFYNNEVEITYYLFKRFGGGIYKVNRKFMIKNDKIYNTNRLEKNIIKLENTTLF